MTGVRPIPDGSGSSQNRPILANSGPIWQSAKRTNH
jgi:hypothetical protein